MKSLRAIRKRLAKKRLGVAGVIVGLLLVGSVTAVILANRMTPPRKQSAAPVALPSPKPTSSSPQPPVPPPPQKVIHDVTIPPVVNGVAPVISRLDTKEPVVFLGIDDGAYKAPFELQLMQQNNVKASLFLANSFIQDNPGFFKGFVTAGSLIEDHTIDHKPLPQLTYEQQKQEICGQADNEEREYGRRPILVRPPGGAYDGNTPRAAAACGMKAVVQWIAKANGGSMQYQIGHSLRPGDIVLMHFRPVFQQDLQAFLDAAKAAGLHTELLEDWLPAT